MQHPSESPRGAGGGGAPRSSRAEGCASAVLSAYAALPSRGKPQPLREWTMLAGITATCGSADDPSEPHRALCLATGTKCISPAEQRERAPGGAGAGASAGEAGLLLNDAHAEVLCVRALRLLLAREAGAHVAAGCFLRSCSGEVAGVGAGSSCRLLGVWEQRRDGAWPLLAHDHAAPSDALATVQGASSSSSS